MPWRMRRARGQAAPRGGAVELTCATEAATCYAECMAPLLSPRQLLDRWRHGPRRARELASLRARFAAQRARVGGDAALVERAADLRAIRIELLELFEQAAPRVCAGCARGHPQPAGRWAGGHCCSTATGRVFTADEVAALALGGSRATRMQPPAGELAGCVFRGPTGCSIGAADRPNICVRYICPELRQALRDTPEWPHLRAAARALRDGFEAFRRALEGTPGWVAPTPPFDRLVRPAHVRQRT